MQGAITIHFSTMPHMMFKYQSFIKYIAFWFSLYKFKISLTKKGLCSSPLLKPTGTDK